MRYLLFALLFTMAHAEAKPKRMAGGASRMDGSEFYSCVQSSLNGRTDGECAHYGQALECIGARLALEYSFLRSKCMYRDQAGCRVHGHKDNTQSQWMSAASGHIALFMECVKHRYGRDGSNGRKEALVDPQLRALLHEIPDGSFHFGFSNGEILLRSLRDERLSSILADSPSARILAEDELETLKQAADNPIAIRDPDGKSGRGVNPTQSGVNFKRAYHRHFGSVPEYLPFHPSDWEAPSPYASSTPPIPVREPAQVPLPEPKAELKKVPDHIFAREYKENPYSLGLDRTLFDRVSLTYRRHAHELKGLDAFIRTANQRAPKDLSEALRRGESL